MKKKKYNKLSLVIWIIFFLLLIQTIFCLYEPSTQGSLDGLIYILFVFWFRDLLLIISTIITLVIAIFVTVKHGEKENQKEK